VTTLALTNQKGGVGKTTTCVNLAASLAANKQRVLLVDIDPQGNASMGSGIDKHELESSVYDVMVGGVPAEDVCQQSAFGFDVIPANDDLTAAEVELISMSGKESRLRYALGRIKPHYDFILIDCPPSLNMLTVNALVASDGVVIPVQCEYYALEGLTSLMNTVSHVQKVLNPSLVITGLVRTMFDPRNTLTNDVSMQLINHFGDKVFRTQIPRNVRLAEAPSHGLPVLQYDQGSRGAAAYLALAAELLRRFGRALSTPATPSTLNSAAGSGYTA